MRVCLFETQVRREGTLAIQAQCRSFATRLESNIVDVLADFRDQGRHLGALNSGAHRLDPQELLGGRIIERNRIRKHNRATVRGLSLNLRHILRSKLLAIDVPSS
jgi:hypothetical protein